MSNTKTKKNKPWKWVESSIDPRIEHIELRYGDASNSDWDSWIPVARIGKPAKQIFPVEWLLDSQATENLEIVNYTLKELNFYLIELGKSHPWEYAIYHCSTAANMYSKIHWSYFSEGSKGQRFSSKVVKLSKQESNEIFGAASEIKDTEKKNQIKSVIIKPNLPNDKIKG